MATTVQLKPHTHPQPPATNNQGLLAKLRMGFSVVGMIAQPILATVTWGVISSLLCFLGYTIAKSPFGSFLAPAVYKAGIGYTKAILAFTIPSLTPFAPWIMFGVPGLLFSYHFIEAAINNRLGAVSSIKELALGASMLVLPMALCSMSLSFGWSLKAGLWFGGLTGAASSIYWSMLHQFVASKIDQRKKRAALVPPKMRVSSDAGATPVANPSNISRQPQNGVPDLAEPGTPEQPPGLSSPGDVKRLAIQGSAAASSIAKTPSTLAGDSAIQLSEDEAQNQSDEEEGLLLNKRDSKRPAPLTAAYEQAKKATQKTLPFNASTRESSPSAEGEQNEPSLLTKTKARKA